MATVEVATPEPSKDVYDSGNDKLDIKRRRRSITDQTSVTEGDVTQTVDDHDDIDDSEAEFEKEEQNAKKEEMLQEVMTDHLDIMLAIIMKIRENEDFAVSIYANCPRLQHLLNQHPDLRPVFEDPNLIRINFEEVYRKAGGVLPEDKPDRFKLLLKYIVNHPLFRIFRFLLLIKKLYTFVMGSGIAVFKGLYSVCFPDPATIAELEDGDVPLEEDAANLANRDALNQAADYMESKYSNICGTGWIIIARA